MAASNRGVFSSERRTTAVIRIVQFAVLWFAFDLLAAVAQRRMYLYYFLPLAGPAAVLYAITARRSGPTAVLAGLLPVALLSVTWEGCSPTRWADALRPTPVSTYIAAHTTPGDAVYNDPVGRLTIESDRDPGASAGLLFYWANDDDAPDRYCTRLIADLTARRAQYVVLSTAWDTAVPQMADGQILRSCPLRRARFITSWGPVSRVSSFPLRPRNGDRRRRNLPPQAAGGGPPVVVSTRSTATIFETGVAAAAKAGRRKTGRIVDHWHRRPNPSTPRPDLSYWCPLRSPRSHRSHEIHAPHSVHRLRLPLARGGRGHLVRQNLFLHALADVADLDLAMFESKPDRVPDFVATLTPLPSPTRTRPGRIGRLWGDLTSALPRTFRHVDAAAARQLVRSLDPHRYDAVFAFRIDFAHYAGVLGAPRLLLDIDDPEHKRWRRRLSVTHRVDARTRRDVDRLEAFEKAAVATAAVSFVCQAADATGWVVPPEVVPNCVDVRPDPRRNPTRPVVLFVGNCVGTDVSPNVDAVVWFLADVWPRVLRAEPAAEFRLVGPAGDPVRRAVAAAARATVVGFVDDLSAEYAAASIAVAPIRFGTGTRIKILDAFAHACPVVSTMAGAEGIDAVPGKQIEIGVGGDDFAARVVCLLGDRDLAERLGRGGYGLVAARYDRLSEQKKLAARFRDFLARR